MSDGSTMAKAMHQFMVKSSAGLFRARFVVRSCDWPSFLEDGKTIYDSVSPMIDDNAGRTRFGGGALVTEVAGPRTIHRVLCVTATTASVFVNVLHRLMSGFAGSSRYVVTRLLIDQKDFESSMAGNGGGSFEDAVNQLRNTSDVRIHGSLEEFDEYPLADETAMHIIGRPRSVVHCVCLVNEMLCETANAAAVLLVDTEQQASQGRRADDIDPGVVVDWNILIEPIIELYDSSIPLVPASRPWPPLEPRPTSPHTDNYDSPQASPTETSVDRSTAIANRPTTPFRRQTPRRIVSKVPPSFTTTTTTTTPRTNTSTTTANPKTVTSVRNVSNRRFNRNQSSRHAAASRPAASNSSVSNRHMNRNQSSRYTTAAATSPPASTWSVSNRHMNRNQSSRHTTAAATSPPASNWSVSNRHMNRNQSSRHAATASARPTASTWSVSDRLVKKDPSQHLADANTTTVATRSVTSARSVSDRLVNRNPSSRVTATTGTPVWSVSDRLNAYPKKSSSSVTTSATAATTTTVTATTAATDQNATPHLSASDFVDISSQLSLFNDTTGATAAFSIDDLSPPIRSVSDRLNVYRKESPSSVTTSATAATTTTATATTAATDQNATPYFSASHYIDFSSQFSLLRTTTEANTAINRNNNRVLNVSERLFDRIMTPRVSTYSNTSSTSSTTTTYTTTDQSSDISIGESGDSSQSDLG